MCLGLFQVVQYLLTVLAAIMFIYGELQNIDVS